MYASLGLNELLRNRLTAAIERAWRWFECYFKHHKTFSSNALGLTPGHVWGKLWPRNTSVYMKTSTIITDHIYIYIHTHIYIYVYICGDQLCLIRGNSGLITMPYSHKQCNFVFIYQYDDICMQSVLCFQVPITEHNQGDKALKGPFKSAMYNDLM